MWSQDKAWLDDNGKEHRLEGITYLTSENRCGLSVLPGVIHQGQNSGYQAINLALLLGAKTVALLGYDMQGRGQHWFGQHPATLSQQTDYSGLIQIFERMKPELYGLEVINCSRSTALSCFPRMSLEEFIDTRIRGNTRQIRSG